jgi:hypothetical protein
MGNQNKNPGKPNRKSAKYKQKFSKIQTKNNLLAKYTNTKRLETQK